MTQPGHPASMPSELIPSPGALCWDEIWTVSDLCDFLCALPNWQVAQTGFGSFETLIVSMHLFGPNVHVHIVRVGEACVVDLGLGSHKQNKHSKRLALMPYP
jgi:hypothetical protein